MAFYTILTDIGKAKLANATSLGDSVSLKEIAVGDGGGVATSPQSDDTALTNEVWRADLNNISIDSSNANWIVCEGYIPSDVGDFTVREVGLFDVDGDMIAIGNYPDTYKPTLDSGSAKDLYIKVIIEVSDADVVELKIDPSVVLSTRKYVDDEVQQAKEYTDSEVAKRALLNGDNTQPFKVADAEEGDEALSKGQLLEAIKEVDDNDSGINATTVNGTPKELLGIGGEGYQWVNETNNREIGTVYQNTTESSIFVLISANFDDNTKFFKIDGNNNARPSNSNYLQRIASIVPPGSDYELEGGDVSIWSELKKV
jgi:phage-related tail fiber protein